MFNATALRARAKCTTRLDSYFKRDNFGTILNGLLREGVPEHEIMITTSGRGGCTMLHDAFLVDFFAWIGGDFYFRFCKRYTQLFKDGHE